MTELERWFLDAKDAHDVAKKILEEAKAALLAEHGLQPCRPCEEDEAATYQKSQIDGEATTISHFAKSTSSWDAEKLEALAETVPAILEARRITYRIEARVSVKKAKA